MSYGEGYELFTCPGCRGALYDPWLGCVDCGYGSERSGAGSGDESTPQPVFRGGDEVLKARLRDEERARAERRDRIASEGGLSLPSQDELLRVASTRGRSRGGGKRRKSKPPKGASLTRATKQQHSALSQNKLMARPSAADHLLWKFPPSAGSTFEEWLPLARQVVGDYAQQSGGSIIKLEPDSQEGEVDRLLYQLYCQLRRKRKQQSLRRQLALAQAIVDSL